MKLRIKNIPNVGYFSQVKFFFSRWQTIGRHPNGYGLYSGSHIDYPLQKQYQAIERCKEYEQWHIKTKQCPTYIKI